LPDRLNAPQRHPADVQVGRGNAAGAALALEGAARNPEGFRQLIESKRQPTNLTTVFCLLDRLRQSRQDKGQHDQGIV
jgi:hypothetical protein